MASADDLVALANSAFVDDRFDEALRFYTQALKAVPASSEIYSKRAATYLKLGQSQNAFDDAVSGLRLSPDDAMLHYRKGLALLKMERFSEAEPDLVQAKTLGASGVDQLIEQCHLRTEGVVAPAPTNPAQASNIIDDRAEAPNVAPCTNLASKVRDSFYDNKSYVSYTIYAKNLKQEDVKVSFDERTISVNLTLPDHSTWQKNIKLFSGIIPSECKYELSPFKVALTLQKKSTEKWEHLCEDEPVKPERIIEQYPTSSKKKPNWNSVEKQVAEEEEKEQPDGDQALNKLFQQIYANANEDTKRAMIKSYQTSGGTVLSTNWNEVKEKNYEESVEAPAGMEVHRWNT